jgi:hypothetical protein
VVLAAIQDAGLDPNDFAWSMVPSEITSVGPGRDPYMVEILSHRPTRHYFIFDIDANKSSESALWTVAQPGPQGAKFRNHAGSWENVVRDAQAWLGWVKYEHEAPDLWEELQQDRERLGPAPAEADNTPFTREEQAEIGRQLRELKTYVRQTHELTAEQYRAIEARLEYFADAAGRLGRVDWRNAFVGAFVSVVMQAVVPQGPVLDLLSVAFRALVSVLPGGELPELLS